MFDRNDLPSGIPADIVDRINRLVPKLQKRKKAILPTDGDDRIQFLAAWARLYLQGHIRRSLSFIEAGLSEYYAGHTIVTASCARSLLEDAAVLWHFANRLGQLLDTGVVDDIDDFIFSRCFSSKRAEKFEAFGREVSATNVLTYVDRMVKLNPGYRKVYDDLSEVVHPNGTGIVFFYAQFVNEGLVTFDEGQHQAESTLGHFITAAYMLVCVEPEIGLLEKKLEAFLAQRPV